MENHDRFLRQAYARSAFVFFPALAGILPPKRFYYYGGLILQYFMFLLFIMRKGRPG
jgi:hypothetical protein